MIHHFARALAVREHLASAATPAAAAATSASPMQQSLFWPSLPRRVDLATRQAVRQVREDGGNSAERHGARVRRDPNDGRRAMISGRFADVCAALDRMVATDTEFEAA